MTLDLLADAPPTVWVPVTCCQFSQVTMEDCLDLEN
jgi:hypothetical protein